MEENKVVEIVSESYEDSEINYTERKPRSKDGVQTKNLEPTVQTV